MNSPKVTDGSPTTFLLVTNNQVITHFYASAVDLHETTWLTDVPLILEKINYSERVTDVNPDYVSVQLTFAEMAPLDIVFDARSASAANIHTTSVKSIPINLYLPGNTKIVVKSWQQNAGDQCIVEIYSKIVENNTGIQYQNEQKPCGIFDFIGGRCIS